jgi:hypothetical protein
VNQGRRLKRLAGLLVSQTLRRQFPQLVVDQRKELVGGLRFSLVDRLQDAGHLIQGKLRFAAGRLVRSVIEVIRAVPVSEFSS